MSSIEHCVIIFTFESSVLIKFWKLLNILAQETIDLVNKAIDHWQENTCIRFVKYNPVAHAAYRCKLLIQPGGMYELVQYIIYLCEYIFY